VAEKQKRTVKAATKRQTGGRAEVAQTKMKGEGRGASLISLISSTSISISRHGNAGGAAELRAERI